MHDDDHGTLRDQDDQPIAYRVLMPGLRDIPLIESQIWPERLTSWAASRYAAHVEARASECIGAARFSCPSGHEAWWMPTTGCPWCKAQV